MRPLLTFATAVLLAGSFPLHAQEPKAGPRFDCSQAKDPKACTERREKLKAARDKARSACEGKQGTDHAACMEQQYCAQAKDPASCEARIKSRVEKRRERREQQEKK